ncbi:MAG: TetR/AcrR family transcriptional regulator C-terminal domain-containing protein [Atopobiaceae bacterium]
MTRNENSQVGAVSPPDRRCVRTRLALRDALASEIEATGDLAQVTVTAVTDRAGLTRRTFYSHFRDIADLVNQIECETVDELRPLVSHLSEVTLDELELAIDQGKACPGSNEILDYFKERSGYLSVLLGDGGDPAFARQIERMVRKEVTDRALNGLDLRALGAFFDYYLTYAVSAEVGVLVRWLSTGAHESVDIMARLMTALMFVRPGDLYGKQIDFDVPTFGLALLASLDEQRKETNHD